MTPTLIEALTTYAAAAEADDRADARVCELAMALRKAKADRAAAKMMAQHALQRLRDAALVDGLAGLAGRGEQ